MALVFDGAALGLQEQDDLKLNRLYSMLSENRDMYEDISEYVCTAQLEPALARLPENQRIVLEGIYGLNGRSCLTSREVWNCWALCSKTLLHYLPHLPWPLGVLGRQTSPAQLLAKALQLAEVCGRLE
jgi:hypothetical protein